VQRNSLLDLVQSGQTALAPGERQPNILGHDADLLHRGTKLLLGAAEFTAPSANLPVLIDVNGRSVRCAAVGQVVYRHRPHSGCSSFLARACSCRSGREVRRPHLPLLVGRQSAMPSSRVATGQAGRSQLRRCACCSLSPLTYVNTPQRERAERVPFVSRVPRRILLAGHR
jgi:hypothetical protein